MSDDIKDDKPVVSAPAIHPDRVWDFDKLEGGQLTNLGFDPVDAKDMTKAEFFKLLNERGLRMKNQQESTTGPEQRRIASSLPPIPKFELPPDLTDGHVRNIAAVSRVWLRYGVREELWCDVCFSRGGALGGGVRLRWGANGHGCSLACSCGVRRHICQTDVSFTRADALTTLDFTESAIYDAHGQHIVPAVLIQDDDVKLTLRYMQTVRALKLNNSFKCVGCYGQCEVKFSDDEIVMLCQCRNRYWKGRAH